MITSTALLVTLPFIAIIEGRKEERKKIEGLNHLKTNIKKTLNLLLIAFAFCLRFQTVYLLGDIQHFLEFFGGFLTE